MTIIGGNRNVTVLSSAARTASTNSPDQLNEYGRGLIVTLDVTAVSATPSILLQIQAKDPASGAYEILIEAPAVTATGTHTSIVYPGVAAFTEDIVDTVGYPLPRVWRVRVARRRR